MRVSIIKCYKRNR